jgi:hypothetical protein
MYATLTRSYLHPFENVIGLDHERNRCDKIENLDMFLKIGYKLKFYFLL